MIVDDYTKLYLPGDTQELIDRSIITPKGIPTKYSNNLWLNKSRWVNNYSSAYQTDGIICSNTGVKQSYGKLITANGSPYITTDRKKFGSSSGWFSGTTSYNLTTPTYSDFNFGTSDFTMEFWAWQPSFKTTNTHVIHAWSSDPNSFSMYFDNYSNAHPGAPPFTLMINQSLWPSCPTCWSLQTWNHFAIVRINNVTLFFVNGELKLTYNTTYTMPTFTTQSLYIGSWYNGGDAYIGYLDELRISNVARYTEAFIPATQAFVPDSYTKLLLHMEGTNNSTYFIDSSKGEPEASLGTHGYFDGSSYLTFPDSDDWYFGTDPYTIDFRVNFNSLPALDSSSYLLAIYTNATSRFSIDVSCYNEYHTNVKYNNQYMPHATSRLLNGTTENLSDGNTGTYWQSDINNNQWVSIDLGISKRIWKVCLTGYSSYTARVPKNFRVEGSSDNLNWNTTYSGVATNVTSAQYFTLNSISDSYRYWRLYMIDNWGDTTYLLLSEFSLYTSELIDVGNVYELNFNANDAYIMSTTWSGVQTNIWYHVALIRDSLTSTKLYIDGIQIGDTFTTNYNVANATSLLVIGAFTTYASKFNGYLDEFRISKGIARWTNNFTPQTTNYTTDYYTKLLLHFDNVYNPTIVVDDSKSMCVENYTSAVYLNGTSYLYMSNTDDYNLGNSDFTIELWYCPLYLPPANQWRGLIVKRNTWSSRHCYSLEHDAGNTIGFYWSYDGVNILSASPIASSLVLGKWYHISVSRKGDTCFTSINGVITIWANTFTGSIYSSSDQLNIGKLGVGDGSSVMTGYLTDIHISRGIARYTKDFIPPTTYREVDQYSKLALRFNDYSGSTYFYDYYEPGYLPGYGPTYFFSGGSCNCYWGDSNDWYFGTGDFTIEFLFRRNSYTPGVGQKILQQWSSTSSAFIFYFGQNSINFAVYPGPVTWSCTWENYDNNWHHLAFVRDALNSVKAYIDGVQIGETSILTPNVLNIPANLYLGGVNTEAEAFNGWITNFKISNGIARYSTNFDSLIPILTTQYIDINTKVLLHFDNELEDSSFNKLSITIVGNSVLSSSWSKFGTTSCYFPDNYSYISIRDGNNFYFADNDFTIDFWIKFASNTFEGKRTIYTQNNTQTNTEIAICINQDNILFYVVDNSNVIAYIIGNAYSRAYPLLSDGNWHHVAIVRYGTATGCISIYVDGILLVLTTTVDLTNNLLPNITNEIKLGGIEKPGSSWLSNWQYRKSFSMSRIFGAVSNYQMKLLVGESSGTIGSSVNCAGLCLSNFNDIRFTTSNGTTLLDYWIESITGTSPNRLATIWIEFDYIGILDTIFYMYYGNNNASTYSNGNNTFPFFDDFEGNSIDTNNWGHRAWSGDTATTVSGSIVTISGIGTSTYNYLGCTQQFGTNYAFRAKTKIDSETVASDACTFSIDDRSATGSYSGTGIDQAVIQSTTTTKQYGNRVNGGSMVSTTRSDVMTDYMVVEIQRNSNINIKYYWNDILKATHTTGLPVDNTGIAFYTNNSGAVISMDWCLVRKYLATEPVWGAWEDTYVYIDEFRISNNIARWTNNFIPPILAYTTPVSIVKQPLCVYSGEVQGLSIGDSIAIAGEYQLTCADYLDVDFISYDVQSITLIKNTLINLSNISNGKCCRLIITQDNIGGRTISFTNFIKWPQGVLPTLSTIGNSTDIFIFIKSRDVLYGDYLKNF